MGQAERAAEETVSAENDCKMEKEVEGKDGKDKEAEEDSDDEDQGMEMSPEAMAALMAMDMAPAASGSAARASASAAATASAKPSGSDKEDDDDNIFAETADDADAGDVMPDTGLPRFPDAQGIIPGGKVAEAADQGLFDDLGPTREDLAPGPAAPKPGLLGGVSADGAAAAEDGSAG